MKEKASGWIIGIGCGERKYSINNVTYTVSSGFEPMECKNNLKDRLERTIVSDFAPLTIPEPQDKMTDEYVCSAAGEEDKNAVENK